jgi:hypothetical protein
MQRRRRWRRDTAWVLISVVPALALMLACAGVDAASAVPAKTFGTPVPRVVLALYDGTAEAAPRTSRLHRFVELPLNVLGYQLAYHDLGAGDRKTHV